MTTERAPLREVMPIDLLPAREVAAARAVREVRLRDHWPRLRALIEAERVLDILDTSLSDIGSDAPDDRLALTDRILFGDERPLLTARRALRRLAEDVERWREELDAERADLCFEMIGLQRGDLVVHGEAGKIARIELTRADLFVRDNRVCISSQGPRFRKDGLPGKRDEMLVFNLQGPRSGG